jgi:ATP-dependent DNA helicase RecQ
MTQPGAIENVSEPDGCSGIQGRKLLTLRYAMDTIDIPINTDQTPERVLKDIFGYQQFRPLQEKIVRDLIAGKNCFVLMPTGAGKSLCFQIPALIRKGVTIVVSPLISLMQDQVAALKSNGVRAEYFNSTLDREERNQVMRDFQQNKLDLLYVAPERLMTDDFLQILTQLDLGLIAIDEAHCISQWGPDFRPEYLQLAKLRQLFPKIPVIALTATADMATREDIVRSLSLQNASSFIASFNRPNIRYTLIEKQKPLQQILTFLKKHPNESGIIYCLTRKRVDELSQKLKDQGFQVGAYHAGMDTGKRKRILEAFQHDDIHLVVATVAFGMGIDKSNVRFVIHHDMPKNIESYYQETGRAGRDSLPAEALLLYGLADVVMVKNLIDQGNNETQKRVEKHKLNAMITFAEAQTCRRIVLLNYFSDRMEVPCGNCDICLNPPDTFDATIAAQKALSCIYRVSERFGVSHLIDILRGAETARIKNLRHDQLSTYGIGADLSQDEWHGIFRQLIHRGYIEQDIANYSILKLTEKARPILRQQETIILAKPRIKERVPKKEKIKREEHKDHDKALFERLRKLRKSIADESHVPPFVVFSDAALVEMCALKPKNAEEFLQINGVGQVKLSRYGEAFLAEIQK